MDHEKLLAKYIQYIGEMEGTDYLGYDYPPPLFVETEWDELRRLAALKALGVEVGDAE